MKKYKIKKRRKTIKTAYIFLIILIICILMATGYSIFTTRLKLNGTITLAPKTAIEIPSVCADENGVTRFTGGSKFTSPALGREVFRVVSETAEGNVITTNLQTINTTFWGINLATDAQITLTIQNNSGYTFTNGQINLIESNNSEVMTGGNQVLDKTTVENGESAVATITGRMYGVYVTEGTYYKYQIRFDVNGTTQYFYYILNVIPKA
ncbi:MAG: hypothetical protein ACI4VQ_06635 [Clostridia bacterium]